MKRKGILCFLFAVIFLFSAVCAAQEDAYKDQIDKMAAGLKGLDALLQSNAIDYSSYDKWYKEFKILSAGLEAFSRSHRETKSFQMVKEGMNGLSLAWGMLNQAKYAEEQFREALTLNDMGGAQKWKKAANSNRGKAIDTITNSIESIRSAQAYQKNGQ